MRGTQLEIYFIWLDTQEERVLLALCEYRERKEEIEGEMCLLIFICIYVCVSGRRKERGKRVRRGKREEKE